MISSFMGALQGLSLTPDQSRSKLRITKYARFKNLYNGYAIRLDQNGQFQYKNLRYNLSRPIVNISADFFAARDIHFTVTDDEEATDMADRIWEESGSSNSFMENAHLGAILGDAAIMIVKDEDKDHATFKWLHPAFCYPTFDPHDQNVVISLLISYDIINPEGRTIAYREEWKEGKVKCYEGADSKTPTKTATYDEEAYGGVPVVWIPNQKVKGECFGRSDLEPIVELVEQYDHLCEKQTRIIDYYANPNLLVIGVSKKNTEVTKGERTMFYVPEGGDMKFIEWSGSPPAVGEHIDRVREAIAEISETPQIAFSKLDTAMNNVSGVALKMLYGPLMSKTERKRGSWGPAMEKAMAFALIASGHQVEVADVTIEWQNPIPNSDVEEWQVAVEKNALGVSQRQILREAGYTEAEIEQMKEEKDQEVADLGEQMLKQFDQGAGAAPLSGSPRMQGSQGAKSQDPNSNKSGSGINEKGETDAPKARQNKLSKPKKRR